MKGTASHPKGLPVRSQCLRILMSTARSDKTLDRVFSEHLDRYPDIPSADRHLIHAIVYGVLRSRSRLDWIVGKCSRTPIDRLDEDVLWILRIGLFQILYLSRIPVSASVHTSVELMKQSKRPWLAGFVNGVLRQAIRKHTSFVLPDFRQTPVAAISVAHSLPEWLVERWIRRMGAEETGSLAAFLNTVPPVTIRVRPSRIGREDLMRSLTHQVTSLELTAVSPIGIRLHGLQVPVFQLEGFSEGYFQVQDEAAQLVGMLLDPQPGEFVLDACAGLGGKTGHIAEMMKDTGRVVATDMDPDKIECLQEEMQRLSFSCVNPRVVDWSNPAAGIAGEGQFDRVLVDAPCSGLGVLRRNPDIRWRESRQNLDMFQARQVKLLEGVMPLVKPSGRLVYAVCSMEPEETDEVIRMVLERHPEFRVSVVLPGLPEAGKSMLDSDGCMRTLPHRDRMDGFFSVCLQKRKDEPA